jgi:DNA-binding HxlR family transcriptional regulator
LVARGSQAARFPPFEFKISHLCVRCLIRNPVSFLPQVINMTVATRSLTNAYAMRAIRELSRGPMRHNAIARAVGFENLQALTVIMKKMVRDGTVERIVLTLGPPPAVEYRLTKLGVELADKVIPLLDWLDQNEPRIKPSRAKSRVVTEAARAAELAT